MIKKKVIIDILNWIENHIEERVTIKNIVDMSGYSRRHLHSIFKEAVGISIGRYIRRRKLCRAAHKLKLTALSLTEIAYSLEYDSQQSFSREFKKLFGLTPKTYRERDVWDMSHLQKPIKVDREELPEVKLCYLPEYRLNGHEIEYREPYLNIINGYDSLSRWELMKKSIHLYGRDIFLISRYSPSEEFYEETNVNTFIGSKYDEMLCETYNKRLESDGLYAHFTYIGEWEDYTKISRHVYREVFPKMKLKRRKGNDVERIQCPNYRNKSTKFVMKCDYYIPITK